MAVSIRYWDREPWVGYLRNDVLPLFKSTLTVLGLWRELRKVAHGRLLSDVIKGIPSLELVFVGGTSPPDRYEEGSLALIYRYLLGTSIKLREYYFLKQHGKEPKTPCTVERTRVVDYIDHVHTLLERAVARALEFGLLAQDDIQKIQESSAEAIRETIAISTPNSPYKGVCINVANVSTRGPAYMANNNFAPNALGHEPSYRAIRSRPRLFNNTS